MIKNTLFLSGINLSGKVLGLIKVIILASIYGASTTYDAYIIAYTLPTTLPQILTIIISTIFIPQYHKKVRDTKESWNGLSTIFTMVVLISLCGTSLLYYFSGNIIHMLTPGISEETNRIAVDLFKIMSLSTLLIGISSFFISLSNARQKFFLASLDSLIINTAIISYCFIFKNESDISSIVFLILFGFFVHLIILMISNYDFLIKFIRLRLAFTHEDFISPMKKAIPIIVGYLGAISTSIVDQWFTSYEEIGSLSVLSYAVMIFLLPMEVFGKAVMETYFSRFSKVSSDTSALIKSYHEGFKLILFILIPISIFLLISNKELIKLIFERGEFGAADSELTSLVLSALSLGLILRAITYFNYRLLHAIDKSWLAISIGLIGVFINILFNYILSKHYGLVGIAISTTISTLSSVVLSCILIKKFYNIKYYRYFNLNFIKILFTATILLTAYNYAYENFVPVLFLDNDFFILAYNIGLLISIPILFFILGSVVKINEVMSFLNYLKLNKHA